MIHYSVFFQMCRAHGIGFDMKVITCCARVSSSFDHVSFAMQYAVQCSVCLRTFRWDFVLFCFIFFFEKSSFQILCRSRLQAIHQERLNLKIRRVGSSSVICNHCLFPGKSWHNFYFGGQFETRAFRNVVS